ncbi:efflux RND transporter periplasmic adaptor subunit [Usitatibacter palustris]|uniref:Multidrug resistance protein MdtA n=1 Tax=Usitatibacter palustris TaxID=2732487 RepID=A0A6M4H387_9PROT|nr:efflux RND transporter periplasmic adaptor subunit [Usitatibacter palustris]QJR13795.1 Multidrug resistance protein MdtA [Usitatibacter palustris]
MVRYSLALVLVLALAACGKGPGAGPQKGAPAAPGQPLLLSAEDVHTVKNTALASGPSITGSVQPERRADLRAEVPAVVLQVLKENGDVVRKGDLLVRLDDTSIRDALASAESTSRSAVQAHEQAVRAYDRMKTLRTSGMASAQALDDAEVKRNNSQSDAEAAKARAIAARQQLARTEVRAPFDGVVSDRKVSAGDTTQIGKELVKVIDPASMRFEGLVSADQIGAVKAGQSVNFRVNGYGDQEFAGKVRRVNPAANATTRQVEVLVDFTSKEQPKLAGLYGEGRIETDTTSSLTLPATSVVRDGDKTSTWRVKDNKVQKVDIKVGERDPRTGDFPLKGGLAEGDKVIRYPTALLKDGQAVVASASPGAATPDATAKNTSPVAKPTQTNSPAEPKS